MVWRPFATKLETAETMEGVALNMRTPYFYPTSAIIKKDLNLCTINPEDPKKISYANLKES
jgi:hypothetical protein